MKRDDLAKPDTKQHQWGGNLNSTFSGTRTNTIRVSATTENVMFANDQFFDAEWRQDGLPPTLAFQNYTDQQSDAASGRHNNTYMIEDTLSY